VRVARYDDAVEAALATARRRGVWLILRIQDAVERRFVVVDGGVERQRTTGSAGIGLHVLTPDGSVGFASVDDVGPEAAAEAVRRASDLAEAARAFEAERLSLPFEALSGERPQLDPAAGGPASWIGPEPARSLVAAQEAIVDVEVGTGRTVRTTHHVVDEEWRVVRSDGCDLSFATPRALTRHELSGRLVGRLVRAAATVSGLDAAATLSASALCRLGRRARGAASQATETVGAPAPRAGSYRLVLGHALAKGLAHEAIGHLCESDVDGSVLMRHGRLRLGERLARETVSVVDGPLPGDYVQQPVSANGVPRQTVALVERGVLSGGLGDLFSAGRAGIPVTGACRAASFRDRPTPRMTNIRIEIADAAPLAVDPDELRPEDVAAALRRAGLLDPKQPTLYLTGYRGGQAHPRRGDFVFGADAAYELTDGVAPRGPASFTGLAERALAAIVAGIGPLCTDAMGRCSKDGSYVSSSGGSHALLVLEPDHDLIVSAAS
jgi:TldD protein